ncbi:hypothetical protein DH2020_015303 [Rehmannia glutinosa]|uniref:Uncharacterized protein n=1 Tax=Rehmannia glutinosa TaxID=99300 RepID=A0ABR0WTU1_REHGL
MVSNVRAAEMDSPNKRRRVHAVTCQMAIHPYESIIFGIALMANISHLIGIRDAQNIDQHRAHGEENIEAGASGDDAMLIDAGSEGSSIRCDNGSHLIEKTIPQAVMRDEEPQSEIRKEVEVEVEVEEVEVEEPKTAEENVDENVQAGIEAVYRSSASENLYSNVQDDHYPQPHYH